MGRFRERRGRNAGPFWLAILCLALLAFVVWPRAGMFLLVSDEPAPSDATFLTYAVNIRRAALDAAIRRFDEEQATRILIGALNSRDAAHYIVPHTSELARDYLVAGGVPPSAIEILPSVSNEVDEAQRLRESVVGRDWQRIVAYAADFRSRRTGGALKKAMAPAGIEVRVVAVRDPEVQLERWWETRPGLNVIYNEYPRLAYYFIRGWM